MPPQASVALNAHLLSSDTSYRSAGIHRYLYNTLLHLVEVDRRISYSVLVGSGQLPAETDWTVARSSWPTHNPFIRILWEQLVLPFVLRRLNPNLFHGMAFSLPWAWNGPSVVTIFDMSFLRFPDRLSTWRRLYLQQIVKSSAKKATQIIAISQSGRKEIASLLQVSPDKIRVALPGLDSKFKRAGDREIVDLKRRMGLPARFILYVGTLEPRKNLDTLLKAYAALPDRKNVKLVLGGPIGWQTGSSMRLIDTLGLQQDIVMPGFIKEDDLPGWYSAAEVFVYPSVYEGFGMPVIEAMACGCPVVVSDTSSLPEAVGNAGMLIPATDVNAWCNTIHDLLSTPSKLEEFSRHSQVQAATFSWNRTARDTVSTYWRALGKEREPHAS